LAIKKIARTARTSAVGDRCGQTIGEFTLSVDVDTETFRARKPLPVSLVQGEANSTCLGFGGLEVT
jgi:hypothetical protein